MFLSRFIPRKGADMLIEAFARVCPESGRLVIAGPEGEPGYRAHLERRAQESGVARARPLYRPGIRRGKKILARRRGPFRTSFAL